MFDEKQAVPFFTGVFVLGGFGAIPLTYGSMLEMPYLASVPWSIASCVAFAVAVGLKGDFSFGRAIVSLGALMFGAQAYAQSTGEPAFAAGGILGFIVLAACGYTGVGVSLLFPDTWADQA